MIDRVASVTYATYGGSRPLALHAVSLLSALFLTYCGVVPAGGTHMWSGISHELLDYRYGHRAGGSVRQSLSRRFLNVLMWGADTTWLGWFSQVSVVLSLNSYVGSFLVWFS